MGSSEFTRCAGWRRNNLVSNGIVDQLGDRMDAKFEHKLGPMGLHSPHRDTQQCGDLFIGSSFAQKPNDFQLAGGRLLVWPLCPAGLLVRLNESAQHDLGYLWS